MLSTLKIIPTKSKHKKLSENYIEADPVIIEGLSFSAKYIGMTLVESPKGEEMAASAIKRIVSSNKASLKESPVVLLTVSPKGIKIKDIASKELITDVNITRISFCTADKTSGKVFGFVSQNLTTEAFECHAYMCGSRKEAQKLALSVAQSFSIAYDISQTGKSEDNPQSEPETSSGFVLDNKKFSNIYRSIADSKYKRFSDSYTSSSEGPSQKIAEINTDDSTSGQLALNFNFRKEETALSSGLSTKSYTPSSSLAKQKSDFTISIQPPPNLKGRNPVKRIHSRSTPTADLIDVAGLFGEKKEESDTENLDFDFAQLALSRTQHESS